MTATTLDVHTARRRYVVVGVVAPLVITATAVVLMLAWLPEVPATVATHWSGDGPDGFAPAWAVPVFTAALGAGITALFAAMADLSREPVDLALMPVWGWGPPTSGWRSSTPRTDWGTPWPCADPRTSHRGS